MLVLVLRINKSDASGRGRAKEDKVSGFEYGGRYEILYNLKEGEYSDKAVGGVRTRTIIAGETLEVEAYPLISVGAPAREEARRRRSSPAQVELNRRNAMKRIRRLLENNFGTGDFIMHPTFDYGPVEDYGFANPGDVRREWEKRGLPEDEDSARKYFRNFVKRVRNYVRRCGEDPKKLKYLYVMEKTREPRDEDINALPARFHFHLAISGLGCLNVEILNALWTHGYTKAEPVDMRYNGLKGFATYIAKRITSLGRKVRWAKSRNLAEPEMRVSDRKISRRRMAQVARDVMASGKEIFEKLYPGYRLEEPVAVRYSDFVAGAYIYARMRRIRDYAHNQGGRPAAVRAAGRV